MINLKTGETKPHSPEFMATVKIPHNYFINIPPLPTTENYIPQLPRYPYLHVHVPKS